jgi:hypothetical protein
MKVRMASRLKLYSRLYSARASVGMALRDFVLPVAEESNAAVSGVALVQLGGNRCSPA